MPWYALSALDDARRATTSLLLPVIPTTWLRVALIAFFVGGVGGSGSSGGQSAANFSGGDVPFELPRIAPLSEQSLVSLVAGVVVGVAVFALLYFFVAAVMEFVFVESVTSRDVRIRRYLRHSLGHGVRLFAFKLALASVVLALVAVPVAAGVLGVLDVSPSLVLVAIPFVFVAALATFAVGIVLQLTTDFVVPTMLAEERGVLDAWRRVLPQLRNQWEQTALYLMVRYVLAIGAALVVGLVVILLALVVALPFVVVGGLLYLALLSLGVLGALGWVLLGFVGVLYGVAVLVTSLLVQVPVVTYFRYYSLFVLGEFDVTLDYVPRFRSLGESPL